MHISASIDYVDILWRSAARGRQTRQGCVKSERFSIFNREYLENGSRYG